MITISLRIEVIAHDRIVVPGREGSSAITSTTLLRQAVSNRATVRLNRALAAIPGSYVEYQPNSGGVLNVRKKWFVLPQTATGSRPEDYYAILASLIEPEDEDTSETTVPECATSNNIPPPVRQYKEEGSNTIPYSGLKRQQLGLDYYGPQTEDGEPLLPTML